MVFGALALVSQVAYGVPAGNHVAPDAGARVSLEVAAWKPRPFADVVLDDPELAASAVLLPGVWGRLVATEALPDRGQLQQRLAAQLAGLLGADQPSSLRVIVAGLREGNAVAAVHDDTVLLALSAAGGEEVDPATLLAVTLVTSRAHPAAPDPRCAEPLLGFAEALVQTGVVSLAGLHPSLRPVRDWLEERDATPALATLATSVFDADLPWAMRSAQLASVGRPGGASPEFAHAAALVVEAFGDTPAALRQPLELLLAWREDREERFPKMPLAVKRALASPLTAGVPKASRRTDVDALAASAVERAVRSGVLPETSEAGMMSPALRASAAAVARRAGRGGVCAWLEGAAAPAAARLGCGLVKPIGFVYARPQATGAEVIARLADGSEAPLLAWPRQVLFPRLDLGAGVLLFVDPEGIWSVSLDGGSAPRLRLQGEFRHLAVGAHGSAAVRWPDGAVVLFDAPAAPTATVSGRGGLAWLDGDVLVASDGDALTLVSLEGESRPAVKTLPCCRGLATLKEALLAARVEPCGAAILHTSLLSGEDAVVLSPPEGPAGLTVLPDGTLVFGTSEGLWSWRGGDRAERIGAGLTPAAFYAEGLSASSR